MNTFIASDEIELKLQPQTHSYSYQRLPNRTYVGMIATHRYSFPKMGGITLSYSPPGMLSHCRHQQIIWYTIVFFAGLNTCQVDQINGETDNQTSTFTQLVHSKLLKAYVTHMFSGLGVAWPHAMPTQLLRERPKKVSEQEWVLSLETVLRP